MKSHCTTFWHVIFGWAAAIACTLSSLQAADTPLLSSAPAGPSSRREPAQQQDLNDTAIAAVTKHLPGTKALDWPQHDGELADRLMDGAHQFVERKIAESQTQRAARWHYDFTSPAKYNESVSENRGRFKRILGVVDTERLSVVEREYYGTTPDTTLVTKTTLFAIHQVRWNVLEHVFSEGLMIEPAAGAARFTIFLPDADQTPEQLVGLAAGDLRCAARIRHMAGEGTTILIPALIDRRLYLGPAGNDEKLRQSNQSHREWIYRQAFHMGRHIIGYEIQKVLAAVDMLRRIQPDAQITVEGVGEGALLAFFAGACDVRIDAVVLHGYFGSRERVWAEPIYRNVFSQLNEFGDAEIASLIHPRLLTLFPATHPAVTDQKGSIPPFDRQQAADEILRLPTSIRSTISLQEAAAAEASCELLPDLRPSFDPVERHDRLFRQLETHVQMLVRQSGVVRDEFFRFAADPRLRPGNWSTSREHPTLEPDRFLTATGPLRQRFEQEAMGRFDEPFLPPHARSRKVAETDHWTAYDIVLDVYPELFAWGVLVVPKSLKEGERRPVVVCQHGRGGLPRDTIDTHSSAYNDFAARLAEQGFITFAPHNLYRGEDRYRWLDRKANNVGCTLFSFIIASHRQTLSWLKTQPFVDPARIAFYGLSYGGETAVRVPAILEDYCLSICSGDFNQWTRKVAATDFPNGFMPSIEWEMPYWDLGHTFDYAEMTYLIFPRPFMVERGHHDLVSVDQWVAHEYAKVRWLYAQYGFAERTEIEFFQGGHSINGQQTFEFLHRQLNWP